MMIARHWRMVALAMTCIAMLAGCSGARNASASGSANTATAVQFVQASADGKYADATRQFDSAMTAAMSPDQLKAMWEGMLKQCGGFKKLGDTRTAQEGPYNEVFVPMEFEKVTLDAKVVLDADGKIGGLWIVEHKDAAAAEPKDTSPSYDNKSAYTESEVTVGSGEWKLPGTLSMPKGDGPFPAVVLVHGSGPNDRDEHLFANRPFRDIAQGLASQGIAVLRYDKRTKAYPKQMAPIKHLTVKEEVLDDAALAVDLLRHTDKVDPKRVFVLGHSLGAMLIPRIGKGDPKLAGLIAMAAPARSLEDVMVDQVQYLTSLAGDSAAAKKKVDEVKAEMAKVKSPKLTADSPAILGGPASYWLDLRSYKQVDMAKSLKQPLLMLQGARDYQVTTTDYGIWRNALAGMPNVTMKLYPDLNHVFGEGKGKSVPTEYEKRTPVPKYVIDDIAGWIKAH